MNVEADVRGRHVLFARFQRAINNPGMVPDVSRLATFWMRLRRKTERLQESQGFYTLRRFTSGYLLQRRFAAEKVGSRSEEAGVTSAGPSCESQSKVGSRVRG